MNALARTREQVVTYQLPRIFIKDTDVRKEGFEDRYGEGAVEIDALEAIHAGAVASLVREAIEPYRDPTLAYRLEEAEEAARELADEPWTERVPTPWGGSRRHRSGSQGGRRRL